MSAVTSVLIYLEVSGESFLQLIKLHLSVSLELKVNFVRCPRSEVPAAQRPAGVPDVCSLAKWSMLQRVKEWVSSQGLLRCSAGIRMVSEHSGMMMVLLILYLQHCLLFFRCLWPFSSGTSSTAGSLAHQ